MMYVGDSTNPNAPYCCTAINRQLHVDDIAAAQYVYGLRGDYNRNGKVDAADYVTWRKTRNQTVIAGTGADGNVDGTINTTDFNTWRANFGKAAEVGFGEQPSFAAGNSVPEPSAFFLLVAAAIAWGASGRANRRRTTAATGKLR
jgi:hypothetical protein